MEIQIKKRGLFLGLGIFSFILALFIGAGFLLTTYPNLPSKILSAANTLQHNAPRPYVIYSGSMQPAIKSASVIVSVPRKNYYQGDVITFSPSGNSKDLVTHRIALKQYPEGVNGAPTYLTAGDANEDFDNWEITNDKIMGKVVFSVPYVGYIADFAKKPQGFILLVIIPATIVIYEELKMLKGEFAKFFSGLTRKIFKKKSLINLLPHKENKRLPKIAALAPIFGALMVILAFSAAYFFDIETSFANLLGAATSYGEKTAGLYNTDLGFTCPNGAIISPTPPPGPFGTAIIKKVGGTIKVDAVLSGATANSTYDIWVNQDPATCPLPSPTAPGAVTTDGSGNGNVHIEIPYVSPATSFWISAVGGGQVLRSTAVTLP